MNDKTAGTAIFCPDASRSLNRQPASLYAARDSIAIWFEYSKVALGLPLISSHTDVLICGVC
jgi:hypothetical protein